MKDIGRSLAFYREVFGVVETYRSEGFLQVETPGCHDVIVFEQAGGMVLSPGEPYAFVADPDGYEVEIWFEPTRTA